MLSLVTDYQGRSPRFGPAIRDVPSDLNSLQTQHTKTIHALTFYYCYYYYYYYYLYIINIFIIIIVTINIMFYYYCYDYYYFQLNLLGIVIFRLRLPSLYC